MSVRPTRYLPSWITVNVVSYGYDNNDDLTSGADYSGTVTYSLRLRQGPSSAVCPSI
jgi:hypothetical protein